jgi:hypothetical protein
MKLEFSRQIFENNPMSNFIKILPRGAELFREDGRTDMIKLMVAFLNFPNAPKNYSQEVGYGGKIVACLQ